MHEISGNKTASLKLLPLILCSLLYGCGSGSGSEAAVTDNTSSDITSINDTETTTDTTTNTTTDTTNNTTTDTTNNTTTDTTNNTTTDTTNNTTTDTTNNTTTDTTNNTTTDTTNNTTTDTINNSTTDTTNDTTTDTNTNTESDTTVEPEPLPEPEPKLDNTISVLFVYTSEFSARYSEDTDLRLQQLINTANQSFQDSTLSVEFTVAGTAEVEFDQFKTDNEALTAITCDLDLIVRNQGCIRGEVFDFVSSLREQTKADIITFVRPYHSSRNNQCGLGWVTGAGYEGDLSHPFWKETTVNVVSVDGPCTEWTFTHEIGHNLGLNHGAVQDATGGTFPWAWGYGEYGSFSTIMTYNYLYGNNAQSIYQFSNPDQTCRSSMCGIPKDESNAADAVSSLKIVIPQVAAFQLSEDDLAINQAEPFLTGIGEGEALDTNPVDTKAIYKYD